jgi:glycerophosphoryl diester phosphodiesterase
MPHRRGPPLVVAHRGASATKPENTIAAVREAIAQRADYVEIDVQVTTDGELVVVHDPISSTLAELRRADPAIPALSDVLEECSGRVGIAVEIKHPEMHRAQRLTERTLAALAAHRVRAGEAMVLSFSATAIGHVRKARPDLRTVQHLGRSTLGQATAMAVWGVGVHDAMATPRRLALARGRRLATMVYTVNDEPRMRELAARGVDAIVSDHPGLLRRAVRAAARAA